MSLDRWLAHGDAPEADWASYLLRRMMRGEIGDGGPGLLLDLPPLSQPYACDSGRCTPGRRAPRARSCCADLDVTVTPDERAAILQALPERADAFDADQLRRPRKRCAFAVEGPTGLACELHLLEDATGRPRGALKPLPCQLFPLAVIDLGDGRRLLSAVHKRTSSRLAAPPARVFPCLGEGPALYVSERETIEAVFGRAVWRRLDAAVRA